MGDMGKAEGLSKMVSVCIGSGKIKGGGYGQFKYNSLISPSNIDSHYGSAYKNR